MYNNYYHVLRSFCFVKILMIYMLFEEFYIFIMLCKKYIPMYFINNDTYFKDNVKYSETPRI